ncbi:MAG: hypothetical protein ACXAB7_07510 [Candidatus Kariarchaeaceae archaeon]
MQRVATFDVVRGIAIFLVLFFHVFFFLFDSGIWESRMDGEDVPFLQLAAMFYFAGWGGLFLMVSTAANSYVFLKRLERGFKINDVFKKQLSSGLLLLVLAIILDILFDVDGLILHSIDSREIRYDKIRGRWFVVNTVRMIAMGVITVSIMLYVFYRTKRSNNHSYATKAFIGLTLIVYAITPLLRYLFGMVYSDWPSGQRVPLNSVGEFCYRTVFVHLSGKYEPLFPYLGSAFIGAVIGISIVRPDHPKHFPSKLLGAGICVKIIAVSLHLLGFTFYPFVRYNFYWYLFTVGGQLMVLALAVYILEYNHGSSFMLKNTTLFRRWGMVSLTIFIFQILSFPVMIVFALLTPWDTLDFQQLNLWQSLIVAIVVMIYWDVCIRYWSRYKFKYSLEWLFLNIMSRSKIGSQKSLDVNEIVYNYDPVIIENP